MPPSKSIVGSICASGWRAACRFHPKNNRAKPAGGRERCDAGRRSNRCRRTIPRRGLAAAHVAARARRDRFVLVTFVDNRQAESSIDPHRRQNRATNQDALESLRKKIEEQRQEVPKTKPRRRRRAVQTDRTRHARAHGKAKARSFEGSRKAQRFAKAIGRTTAAWAATKALKEQFQKMKNLGAGPADKAAEA